LANPQIILHVAWQTHCPSILKAQLLKKLSQQINFVYNEFA